MVKLSWKPDAKLNPQPAGLPKQRGSAVVFYETDTVTPLPRYPRGYCVHLSWDGNSFRIRNFIAGQTAAQDGETKATEAYEAGSHHQPCVGDLAVPVTDSTFWLEKLAEMTAAIYQREGWKLGKE